MQHYTFSNGFCLWCRLLRLLVLPLFRLYHLQEVRPVSLSPPAGHRLHPPHHLGHEGLHAGALRHQSRVTHVHEEPSLLDFFS